MEYEVRKQIAYRRVEADDFIEAKRLFDLGYRQVSNRWRMIARIDGRKRKFDMARWQEDDGRRRESRDRIENVDENVMALIRRLTRIEMGWVPCTAVCLDNRGYESYFDKGIEYVQIALLDGMIWVLDKFGQMRQCLDCRFAVKEKVHSFIG